MTLIDNLEIKRFV